MKLWIAGISVCLIGATSQAQPIREAWAAPTTADLGDIDQGFRAESPERYLIAHGDFNGDGEQDRAAIVVRRASGEAAVLLYLAGRDQAPLVLNAFPSANISQLGIRTLKPGTHQPACARRGGADCDPATRITIPNDGISLFISEGSATYYWLDKRSDPRRIGVGLGRGQNLARLRLRPPRHPRRVWLHLARAISIRTVVSAFSGAPDVSRPIDPGTCGTP